MRPFPYAAAFLLAVAAASVSAAHAQPDSLPARWTRLMDALHVPGMAVVVVRDTGTVRIATLGVREVERGLPVTPDTRFYIASCTKPIVATAAALLAAEGRLDLDAPVRRHLPRFRVADPGLTDSLTVRDLLSHRYGLVSRAISHGDAYTGQMTEERYWRLVSQVTPRRRFSYSNLHYTLTGRVIAAAAGTTWKDFLARRLFTPAGMMRATSSARALAADPNAARPYAFTHGRWAPAQPPKVDATMHAAGGIAASPRDLARWLRLELGLGVLDGRRVIPAAALRVTREPLAWEAAEDHPLVPGLRRVAWGAGWEVRTYGGDTLYSHNGQFAGASALLCFMPARNVGVAVVTNGSGAAIALAELVAAEALESALGIAGEDAAPRLLAIAARMWGGAAAPPVRAPLGGPARAYAGRFQNEDWGTLELSARGDSLAGRMGALPLPILVTGRDRFVAGGDTPGSFERGPDGRLRAVWLRMSAADSVRFARH